MKLRKTLTKRSDFISISKQTNQFVCDFFILQFRQTIYPNAKYGITASKKTFENSAIKRNRAIRLIREWIRLSKNKLNPNLDYVVIARHKILQATLSDGLQNLEKALKFADDKFNTNNN